MGIFSAGVSGFGRWEVSGRNRVPSPPAIITAFIQATPVLGDDDVQAYDRYCRVQRAEASLPSAHSRFSVGQDAGGAVAAWSQRGQAAEAEAFAEWLRSAACR